MRNKNLSFSGLNDSTFIQDDEAKYRTFTIAQLETKPKSQARKVQKFVPMHGVGPVEEMTEIVAFTEEDSSGSDQDGSFEILKDRFDEVQDKSPSLISIKGQDDGFFEFLEDDSP